MYLSLGNNYVIKNKDIIGIFDIDNTTVSKKTKNYLYNSDKRGEVTTVSYELPKSFIVTSNKKNKNKLYISQLSTQTVIKRMVEFKKR